MRRDRRPEHRGPHFWNAAAWGYNSKCLNPFFSGVARWFARPLHFRMTTSLSCPSSFPYRRGAVLSLLHLPVSRRLGQSQNNERFAGHGTDVVVQAHYRDASDSLDQRLHEWLCRFDQMGAYLLEQVPPLLGRAISELLFR